MTAASLAAFALSDQGQMYGSVCEFWGTDPGAPLDDDVLAFNLRVALMITRPKPVETDDRSGVVTDLESQLEAMLR